MRGPEFRESIRSLALAAGFVRARFLAPFETGAAPIPANYREGSPSLLTLALVYGNCFNNEPGKRRSDDQPGGLPPASEPAPDQRVEIAPFAQRNYYREAVKRLQNLARLFRSRFGGNRSGFRILCNSPVPEIPLALGSGLGALGRNGLLLTGEAGSLFIIAALTLPYELAGDKPMETFPGTFPLCAACDPVRPPCTAACPTGALGGDGTLQRERCIQWYASGHGREVPPEVIRRWGKRLYGCTDCQDACVLNQRPLKGVETGEGPLPAFLNGEELLALDDSGLNARFKGTALGLSWLTPEAIRRNTRLALS